MTHWRSPHHGGACGGTRSLGDTPWRQMKSATTKSIHHVGITETMRVHAQFAIPAFQIHFRKSRFGGFVWITEILIVAARTVTSQFASVKTRIVPVRSHPLLPSIGNVHRKKSNSNRLPQWKKFKLFPKKNHFFSLHLLQCGSSVHLGLKLSVLPSQCYSSCLWKWASDS